MKDKIEVLSGDLRQAVKEVGEKHNVKVTLGTMRYGDADVTCKLTGLDMDATGGKNQEELDYEKRHHYYGLPADGIGREFDHFGKTFVITGLKPTRRKYPVSAKNAEGKGFKFPAKAVIDGIKSA